jgi:hypothetical protein
MKTSFSVLCGVLLLPSFPSDAAEPGGQIATRVISIVEQRAKDLSGENVDFPFMPGLRITLELSGPPVRKATHWGKLAIAKAVDDRGVALALEREPSDDLEEIQRPHRFSFEPEPAAKGPEDRIRIELAFKESARAATAIKALEGSLCVRVVEKKEVIISAPAKLVGKTIEDKTLKAVGVSLAVVEFSQDGPTYLKLTADDPEDKIGEMDITDAKGKSFVSSRGSMRDGDQNAKKEISLGGDDKLPPDARIKISVATSRMDIPVTLRLENLPLP